VDDLRATPAHIKFISAEPLIGSVKGIDLTGIDWVIIGGESGDINVRRMDPLWVKELIHQCNVDNARVFVKQMGRHLGQELGMSGKKGNDGTKFPTGFRRWEFPIDMSPYLRSFK
jgi:protein gp37